MVMQALDTSAETTALIVRSAGPLLAHIGRDLESQGWHVWERTASDVVEGRVGSYPPDAVILVPREGAPDPVDVIQSLDEAFSAVPVLVVTDDADVVARVLQAGAAGVAPTATPDAVLCSQVRALQRMVSQARVAVDPAGIIRVRTLKVDTLRCEVWAGNKRIDLTPTEYRILHTLARHPGRALSSDFLLQQSSGNELPMPGAREIVKVHVARLRKKLREATGERDFIRNVRNVGYLLERRRRGARRG